MNKKPYSVLFVCLGNICRSPLAEGIFRHLVEERGLSEHFHIESCGTGAWHQGEGAHRESVKIAKKHGISLAGHQARQVAREDFHIFDLLLAMDRDNLEALQSMGRGKNASIRLMREYDSTADDLEVPDPFYGGTEGFQDVYDMLHRACSGLLKDLESKLSAKKSS